jgi:hypothetical protein
MARRSCTHLVCQAPCEPLLRRSICAAGQPACPQVSGYLGLSGSDREFPVLTGRSGTQRARRPLRRELAAPLGVWPSSQLTRCAGGLSTAAEFCPPADGTPGSVFTRRRQRSCWPAVVSGRCCTLLLYCACPIGKDARPASGPQARGNFRRARLQGGKAGLRSARPPGHQRLLTPVTTGFSRSLTDSSLCRSGGREAHVAPAPCPEPVSAGHSPPRPRGDELPGRAGPRLTIRGMSALRWRASVSHARVLSARDTC